MKMSERILGFDYGTHRIGVAVGNLITHTAQPLTTVNSIKSGPGWRLIDQLIEQWSPHTLIIGLPISMTGEETGMSTQARKFGEQLYKRSGINVRFVDERLSSKAADLLIAEVAQSEKQHKKINRAMRDPIAAQLILQTYLSEH